MAERYSGRPGRHGQAWLLQLAGRAVDSGRVRPPEAYSTSSTNKDMGIGFCADVQRMLKIYERVAFEEGRELRSRGRAPVPFLYEYLLPASTLAFTLLRTSSMMHMSVVTRIHVLRTRSMMHNVVKYMKKNRLRSRLHHRLRHVFKRGY